MVILPKEISKIVKNPVKNFEENPVGILEVISFACEAEYDLDEMVFKSAVANVKLLGSVPVDKRRELFEKIIASKQAGKGITLLTRIGAMDYILGEQVAQKMSNHEMADFSTYVENIDKTNQNRVRRLALFYKCFNPKKAEIAIKNLEYSPEDEECLLDGLHLLDRMYFLTNKYDMKKFLVKYGMKRYEFLADLSKAQRIVFDISVNRIHSREYVLDNIKEYNEPIFEEDLAIGRQDLIDEGVPEKNLDRIFEALVDLSHMRPNLNTKKDMLKYAHKYNKNKWAATFKKIKYIK